jgi:tetratricopeptide (TPR) repeat protein
LHSESLEDGLRAVIARGKAVVVVGTGVSLAASGRNPLAGWVGLLKDGIQHCLTHEVFDAERAERDIKTISKPGVGLDDLLDVASAVERRLKQKQKFAGWLHQALGSLEPKAPDIIKALGDLGLPILTTNYDLLIGKVLNRQAVNWRQADQAAAVARGDVNYVLHLHGNITDHDSIVFGEASYKAVGDDPVSKLVKEAVATLGNFIFVGCGVDGLTDPDLGPFFRSYTQMLPDAHHGHYRLCLDSEKAATPPGITAIGYGTSHEGLLPLLRGLAPAKAASPPPSVGTTSWLPLPAIPAHRVVGRDAEIAKAEGMLAAYRPFAVIGGPGIGKSTVALAALHRMATLGRRRAFVRLDGAGDAAALFAKVGEAMGLPVTERHRSAILDSLSEAPAALVLDNFEDPRDADPAGSEDAVTALAGVPGLALAIAARGRDWPVKIHGNDVIDVEPLAIEAARTLFLDITGDRFAGDTNRDRLIRALGRVPLAVRLLALLARTEPDLSLLMERWESERTALLKTGRGKDNDLDACIALSLQSPRLTDDGRALLSLLGRLPDGLGRDEIKALLAAKGLGGAGALVAIGLADWEGGRLRCLAPVREFLAVHLPPAKDLLNACVWHYLQEATEGARVGRDNGGAVAERLAGRTGNLEAMMDAALDGKPDLQAIGMAVEGYAAFCRLSGFGNPVPLVRRVVGLAAKAGDTLLRANCIFVIGGVSLGRDDIDGAAERFREAWRLYRGKKDILGEANCRVRLGEAAIRLPDLEEAARHLREALALYRGIGDSLGEGNCKGLLGQVAIRRSATMEAVCQVEEALFLFHRIKEPLGEANCILHLGEIALCRLDFEEAVRRFDEARPIYRRIGAPGGEANCALGLGQAALDDGRLSDAGPFAAEGLGMHRRSGDWSSQALAMRLLGDIALAEGDRVRARQHFAAAQGLLPAGLYASTRGDILRGLGDVALAEGDAAEAGRQWQAAAEQYARLPNPDSLADIDRRFARIATDPDERRRLVAKAREAWVGLEFDKKVADLGKEFPPQ